MFVQQKFSMGNKPRTSDNVSVIPDITHFTKGKNKTKVTRPIAKREQLDQQNK